MENPYAGRPDLADCYDDGEEPPPLCANCGHRAERHGMEINDEPYCAEGCDCREYDGGGEEDA